jgi:S-formylglutathione hydrolase FrmB
MLPLLLALLPACQLLPAPTPMAHTLARQPGPAPARCLVVLLPGAGDRMGAFADNGFVAAIQASGASVDILSADATMGYYFRGVVGDRLEQDLLAKARAGHEHVWIVGVSMGGFGSLHYTQQHPEHVDGVIALAPYLGDRKLGEEIVRAGGLARWTPDPPAPLTKRNYQRQLWSWLHRTTAPGAPGPALLLGYGDDDRLASANGVLAAALPVDRVFHGPGGHDWPVWRTLLAAALAHPDFTRSCAAAPVP